jgi:UDP-glucose 4-epimerase
MMHNRVLVTGAAGFIGSHLSEALLSRGYEVYAVDSFDDFYDRRLKEANLSALRASSRFTFREADLSDANLGPLLRDVDTIFHLAARAGVRTSWGEGFGPYVKNNIIGMQRLLEASVQAGVRRVVYASSSSVYGQTEEEKLPTSEDQTGRPISPYGITKLAGEHLLTAYGAASSLEVVGLRFFTVFGPRQRPDMAFHRFLKAALDGRSITLFGDGSQTRDFTFVEDIVAGVVAAGEQPAESIDARMFNLGGGHRVTLKHALNVISEVTHGRLRIDMQDRAAGDVTDTAADTSLAKTLLGYSPKTDLGAGIAAEWQWILGARQAGLL